MKIKMGFIKKKVIRGFDKYYWVVAKRDSKKLGGTGKVKTIEYYLGDSLYSLNNLSWYVWNNDIKIKDCINKIIWFHLKYYLIEDKVNYHFQNGKIYFEKLKKATDIDLRQKSYKYLKEKIEYQVKTIKEKLEDFEEKIEKIIEVFKHFNKCVNYANEYRLIDTDNYFYWCNFVDYWFTSAQSDLNRLLNQVPKTQKQYAKDKIWKYCLRKCPLNQLEL